MVVVALGAAITPSDTQAANETYTYDTAGRLITVDHGDGRTTTYTLDAAGNRTNVKTEQAGSPGTLSIATASATYAESQGTVTVVIRRSGGVTGAASVNVSLTASSSDATVSPASVSWGNGDSIDKNVTVTIVNDMVLESTESFNLSITGPGGATLGSPSSITFTITDDDQTETIPPTAPTNFTANAVSATQINLAWTASTDASGISQYRIERCSGSGCTDFSQIATTTSTSYSNTGLSEITTYRYQVRAVDGVNNAGPYSSAVVRATLDATGPTAPGGFGASVVNANRVDLSWSAASDNVGVSGYRVERCVGVNCTGFSQIGTTANNMFAFSDTSTVQATNYQYRVYAVDAVPNAGAYSAVVPVSTPDGTAPSVPGGLNASVISEYRIDLSWNASSDNVGVTGYKVYRDGVPMTIVGGTSYSADVLVPSTTYSFQVSALDAAGNESGLSTPPVSARTRDLIDATPPTAPAGLAATIVSSLQVNLSWGASTDTGGSGLQGYRIYRNGTQIGTLPPSTTPSYSDTTTTGLTQYTYVVYAYDGASPPNQSGASNSVSVTPPDDIPPTKPAGLTATAVNGNTVNLSWSASTDQGGSGVTWYWVYRNGSNINVVTHPTTTYQDTGATAGATITYTVIARDGVQNQSPASDPASVTTPNVLSASVNSTTWTWRRTGSAAAIVSPTTVVVSASGGTGTGYTYLWDRVVQSGDDGAITVNSGSSASTFWRRTGIPTDDNAEYVSHWRCKVTDSSGAFVYTPLVTVQFNQFSFD